MNLVIVDLQQVMISNMMQQLGAHKNVKLEPDMLRHMVLNSIRSFRQKFKQGEIVIACDTRRSWRKDVFPYYKAARAKNREVSEIDWHSVFVVFEQMRHDLKTYFPYRVIEVEGAEADDIIGVLCNHFGTPKNNDDFGGMNLPCADKIQILSGDKDFKQLQRYDEVRQYDPVLKRELKTDNPIGFLKEHIIRGDVGDGVPNILSDDDVLVTPGKRQKPIMQKKLDVWLMSLWDDFCGTDPLMNRNWKRNEELIDLSRTPERIVGQVLSEFDSQAGKGKGRMESYFIKNRLKNLHACLNEF